jgi:uncharacterized protein YeaO (DUF488 family)
VGGRTRPEGPAATGGASTLRRGRFAVVRVYDLALAGPGLRVLVDRLWPRGISRDRAGIDEWLKEVAPSTALRRWYGHDTARFEEFARRYRAELAHEPAAAAVDRLVAAGRTSRVRLVTATRDVEHSAARVLCDHLASLAD